MSTIYTDFSPSTDPLFLGGKGLRHSAPSGQRAVSWDSPGAVTDAEALLIFAVPSKGSDRRVRLVLRGGGSGGSEDGYIAEASGYSSYDWVLHKVVNGSFTTELGGQSNLDDFVAGVRYALRFRIQGTTLQARYWRWGTDEPEDWSFETTDPSLASGWVGISGRDSDGYFDYISVDTGGGSAPLPGETPGTNQHVEDFSSDTVSAFPSDFTEEWATSNSTWTVVDDATGILPLGWVRAWADTAYAAVFDDAAAEGGRVLRWDSIDQQAHHLVRWVNAPDSTDQEVLAEITVPYTGTTSRGQLGVVLRASGQSLGEATGYLVRLEADGPRRLGILRLINNDQGSGAVADQVSSNDVWSPGVPHYLAVEAIGDQIRARIWAVGEPDPEVWQVTLQDDAIEEGGLGIYTSPQNAFNPDPEVDHITLTATVAGAGFEAPASHTTTHSPTPSLGAAAGILPPTSLTTTTSPSPRMGAGAGFAVPVSTTETISPAPSFATGLGASIQFREEDIPAGDLPMTGIRYAVFGAPLADSWGAPLATGSDGVIDESRTFRVDLSETALEPGDIVYVYLHDLTPAQLTAWEADPEDLSAIEFRHAGRPAEVS